MKNTFIDDLDKKLDDLAERITELETEYIDDLPVPTCECRHNDFAAQVEVLHRFCVREYNETSDKYKWNSAIAIKKIADIFGWTDMDFVPKEV